MPKVLYHGRQLSSQYYAIMIFDFKELVRLATGVRSKVTGQLWRSFYQSFKLIFINDNYRPCFKAIIAAT